MDMNRRHRAATMFLLFVLLLGGLGLLTADLSAGQQRQVQGVVTEAGFPFVLLSDVTVSLIDAHGQKAPLSDTTLAGAYAFTPSPGFYRITVETPGYFDNETTVFRFDNTVNVIRDLEMEKMLPTDLTLTVHVEESVGAVAIDNATVDLFNVTMEQVVATNLTNATGNTTFPVWAGDFELRVDKEDFEREVMPITITMSAVTTVMLNASVDLVGIAREPDGTFVSAGLVAFLYNTDGPTPDAKRLLVANVTGSSYAFSAYNGTFILIVDADGKAGSIDTIVVSGSDRIDRTLEPSPEERVDTTIRYAGGDWNTLNLWRNLSFNDDSTFPGLPFASVRNLRLQIDLALGDGDGSLDAMEQEAFRTNLTAAGPKHVDTKDFFTTNGEAYRSDLVENVTDYTVSFATFDLVAGAVNVTTLANYTAVDPNTGELSSTIIPPDEDSYFVNITAPHDVEAEVRVNTTYTVEVVPTYERETQTITGAVDIQSYVRIVVDPLVAPGNFRVDMEVAKSEAGTARVLVVAPPDRFTETNVSEENYTAIVPTNESMTFTAEESTDPNSPDGRINPDSNFTWLFINETAEMAFGIQPNRTAFGIRPNVTFGIFGNYSGNLTIKEVGKNVTFANFTLNVDGILPIAVLENDVRGFGMDANNTTLTVDEGQTVGFFAGNSTDRVHDEMVGVIREYRWDFDGDDVVDANGQSVDWTFDQAGEFTVNLTVVDQAGHESLNATLTAMVSDTSPPTVELRILDEDFQEVTSLVEKVSYIFDGSESTDNLDSVQNMTFEWDFGDGNMTTGVNVTHAFDRFGTYDILLTVTDRAGNEGNATRSVVVGVEPEDRPDLEIEPNILLIDPESPEESTLFGSVSLSLNFTVTNKPDRARANNVQVSFFAFQFGQSPGDPVPGITFVFKDVNGSATDNTLDAGETKVVEFTWITGSLGNYTLRVNVTDPEEPDLFIGPRNTAERQVDIREAAWKQPLLIGSIIAIIVGIPVALFLRRRLRGRGRERITR